MMILSKNENDVKSQGICVRLIKLLVFLVHDSEKYCLTTGKNSMKKMKKSRKK